MPMASRNAFGSFTFAVFSAKNVSVIITVMIGPPLIEFSMFFSNKTYLFTYMGYTTTQQLHKRHRFKFDLIYWQRYLQRKGQNLQNYLKGKRDWLQSYLQQERQKADYLLVYLFSTLSCTFCVIFTMFLTGFVSYLTFLGVLPIFILCMV